MSLCSVSAGEGWKLFLVAGGAPFLNALLA